MKNKSFLLLLLFVIVSISATAQEQHPENCPLGGRVDCKGYCGLFTDEDGDGFCDYAILSKQQKNTKQYDEELEERTIIKKENIQNTNQEIKVSGKNNATQLADTNLSEEEIETTSGATETMTESVVEQTPTVEIKKAEKKFPYHLWEVMIATLVLYIISVILVKVKTIKKITHRKFWNVILLITCLVSCLLGVYVVFAKMYNLPMDYMTLMQLHVDFGISMTIVAIIHIFWHLKYWKNLFKSVGNKA